jgi:hypothetical protein
MLSLQKSTRTCKVDTASAARIESDRFLNPSMAVCPRWNGRDLAGRHVTADSFMTKTAGCASAEDRVIVENALRPQYFEYINLDSEGIRGQLYQDNMYFADAGTRTKGLQEVKTISGNFGDVYSGANLEFSGNYKNDDAMAFAVKQMDRQVARNNKRPKEACTYRNELKSGHQHRRPHHPHHSGHHNHHTGQVVEGFTDRAPEHMVMANKNHYRKTAAVISGFRNCNFTTASGF